jgi:hypothetical protein
MTRAIENRLHAKLEAWVGTVPMTAAGLQIVQSVVNEVLEEIVVPGYSVVVHELTDEDRRLRRSPRIELSFHRAVEGGP